MKSMKIKIKKYYAELKDINKELQELPEGYLIKRGGFYYQRTENKEVGITKKPNLIRQLCRKKYLLERKKQLDENLSVTMHLINELESSPEENINSFSTAYQSLPTTHFFHPSIDDWLAKPYKKNPHYKENLNYQSKNGTPVRSKSEVMIANLLEEYNIPYHYEIAIQLGTQTRYPDFVIKNPFTGKTIIWEHFGALNQPNYEKNMNEKIQLYQQHGYQAFENFIYTFEFDMMNDQCRAKELIEQIIL